MCYHGEEQTYEAWGHLLIDNFAAVKAPKKVEEKPSQAARPTTTMAATPGDSSFVRFYCP